MLEKLKIFIQESRQEFKRVNWPTKQETIRYTIFVIGISLALAVYLGFLDFIFARILEATIL